MRVTWKSWVLLQRPSGLSKREAALQIGRLGHRQSDGRDVSLSPWFSPLSHSAFPGHCSLIPLLSHPFVSTCLCTFSPHRPSLPKGGSAQWWTTPERLGRSEREGSRGWLSLGDSVYFSLILKHTSVLLKQDLQAHVLPAHRNSNTIHKACLSDCLVPRPYPPSQRASESPSSPC